MKIVKAKPCHLAWRTTDGDDQIRVYHGDCMAMLKTVDTSIPWAIVTDPPYGMSYRPTTLEGGIRGRRRTEWAGEMIACDDDTQARDNVLKWGLEHSIPALVFGTWKVAPYGRPNMTLVWDKGAGVGLGDLKLPWGNSWEEIYVYGRKWIGRRGCSAVIRGHTTRGRRHHPNEKPASLMTLLLNYIPKEYGIIDPFLGSGSTLRAAQKQGRRAIGCDIDAKWCKVAIDLLSGAYHKQGLPENSGFQLDLRGKK